MASVEALVWEHGQACRAMQQVEEKVVTEWEARLTTKARDEALQRKMAEAAKARKMAEGAVVELRASLRVLETTRVAALSELSKS